MIYRATEEYMLARYRRLRERPAGCYWAVVENDEPASPLITSWHRSEETAERRLNYASRHGIECLHLLHVEG